MQHNGPLTEIEYREIAAKLACDVRSVRKRARGEKVRGVLAIKIDRELAARRGRMAA